MKMGLFDKIKGSLDNASRYADLRKKIENNEIATLTEDDRNFFEITAKKTPEEYLVKYEEQQAEKAENERIKALKKAEMQYNIGGLKFRKDSNGLYYFGNTFQEGAGNYKLVDFIWDGPQYNLISKTTGKNKTHGRAGSALIGAAVAGPVGAVVGASLGKKTKVNTKTTTTQQELDTIAFLVFEAADTGARIQKEIKCNTTIANEVRRLTCSS